MSLLSCFFGCFRLRGVLHWATGPPYMPWLEFLQIVLRFYRMLGMSDYWWSGCTRLCVPYLSPWQRPGPTGRPAPAPPRRKVRAPRLKPVNRRSRSETPDTRHQRRPTWGGGINNSDPRPSWSERTSILERNFHSSNMKVGFNLEISRENEKGDFKVVDKN